MQDFIAISIVLAAAASLVLRVWNPFSSRPRSACGACPGKCASTKAPQLVALSIPPRKP